MLTPDERDRLRATLLGAFGTLNFFAQLVQHLGLRPDDFKPREGISERIDALIDDCEARQQIPHLLQRAPSVPGWTDHTGLKASLDVIYERYMARTNTPIKQIANPFEACFLYQGRPFINRDTFRSHLQNLSRDNGQRFLVVNGPSGAGKSYSHYFIEALSSRYKFTFSYIELKKETPSTYYPDIMVRRLDRDLMLPTTESMPAQQSVPDRWATELCDWLVRKLRANQRLCWIVLDGFGHHDLPAETRQLVSALIDAVDQRLLNVRLVLLDYPASLPRELQPFVQVENIAEIGHAELELFFQRAFTHAQIAYDQAQIHTIVARIWEGIQADQDQRMFELMCRVIKTANQVLPEHS